MGKARGGGKGGKAGKRRPGYCARWWSWLISRELSQQVHWGPLTSPAASADRPQHHSPPLPSLADQGPGCSGRCLYISGIPGTGKTATVLEVMRSARQRVESGEVPAFRFVEINGLRLASPQHAYCALHEVGRPGRGLACDVEGAEGWCAVLSDTRTVGRFLSDWVSSPCEVIGPHTFTPSPHLQALTGEHLGPSSAAAALERMFCGGAAATCRSKSAPPKRPVIVLVDELDLLVNRAQVCVVCGGHVGKW